MRRRVAGVDGARDGWVVAELDVGDDSHVETCTLRLVETIDQIAEALRVGGLYAAVVDMPIGLSGDGIRPVDQLARARLGARRSTFFPTPVRSVLTAASWENANETSKRDTGKGLSKQTWNLVPKIREIDRVWGGDLADRLVEGHPEVSFAEMTGAPLMSKKATADGRDERLAALAKAFAFDVRARVDACPRSWQTDAVDALAIAWTARRLATGTALVLGGDTDPAGRPMQLTI